MKLKSVDSHKDYLFYIIKTKVAAFLFFITFTFFFISFPVTQITDSRYVVASADLFLRTGSFDLWPIISLDTGIAKGSWHALVNSEDLPQSLNDTISNKKVVPFSSSKERKWYVLDEVIKAIPDRLEEFIESRPKLMPLFPLQPSLLVLPVAMFNYIIGNSVYDGTRFDTRRNQKLQKFLAAILSSTTASFFFITCRNMFSLPISVILTTWLASGLILSNTSRSLWSDTAAMPFIFYSILLLVNLKKYKNITSLNCVIFAACLAVSVTMKPLYLFPGCLIAILFIFDSRIYLKKKIIFMSSGFIFMSVFFTFTFFYYHDIIPPYFQSSRLGNQNWTNFLGLILSPSRGVVWFAPSMVIAIISPLIVRQNSRYYCYSWLVAATALFGIIVVSRFNLWWGGGSFGPRLLQFIIPLTALQAIFLIDQLNTKPLRAYVIIFICLSGLWEGIINFYGAYSARGWDWNGDPDNQEQTANRLWDWSDPQFLAFLKKTRSGIVGVVNENQWVELSDRNSENYLHADFSGSEPIGRWTDGNKASLIFRTSETTMNTLTIQLRPYLSEHYKYQLAYISVNDQKITTIFLNSPQFSECEIILPDLKPKTEYTINLSIPYAHQPPEFPNDSRLLGFMVRKFKIGYLDNTKIRALPNGSNCSYLQ